MPTAEGAQRAPEKSLELLKLTEAVSWCQRAEASIGQALLASAKGHFYGTTAPIFHGSQLSLSRH
jgi:hypothetical protein